MALISNLYVDQGTSFSTVLDLSNDDGTTFDLTGYLVKAQIRKYYDSSSAVDFASAVNLSTGEITISLTPAQTSALKSGRYVYDVLITSPNNTTATRIVEGTIVINPGASR